VLLQVNPAGVLLLLLVVVVVVQLLLLWARLRQPCKQQQ
jgi:hypothetical protein